MTRKDPDLIRLDRHFDRDSEPRPEGVSTRSRANAVAASRRVAHLTILGVGGFVSGATLLGLGLAFLPPLVLPGAVVGLIGSAFLGLSTVRQAPIAGHLWRFGDRVLAVATTAGVAAGAGALLMGVSGLGVVGQAVFGEVGVGTFGGALLTAMRAGGGLAVVGAVIGLTLYALANLLTRRAEAI